MRTAILSGLALLYHSSLSQTDDILRLAATEKARRQSPGVPCNASGSDWQPNVRAFNDANTLSNLQTWNHDRPRRKRFDTALGQMFSNNNFYCGLNSLQCEISATCLDFEQAQVPAWVYQAAISAENFDNLLDYMYMGINLAQVDTTQLTPNLADQVFKWKDPNWELEDILQWVGFALTIIFACGAPFVAGAAVGAETVAAFGSIGAIAGGVPQEVSSQLQLSPTLTRSVGIDQLNALFYNVSIAARTSLATYAENTFAGLPDANNNTIIDILGHGAYATRDNIPQQDQVESFFKTFLVAKAINSWWQQQNIYVISTTAVLNSTDLDYPRSTSWYSNDTGRTYIPYYFDGARPQEPPGLSILNGSFYEIYTHQVAESAGRAWEVASFNYTTTIARERIEAAFTSPRTLQPFQAGAGWEGVFNFGVCDIQDRIEWVVPYGSKPLPCCCGVDCKDTWEFVQSVNLNQSYAWLHACKKQLKGTDIDPSTIDFGIQPSSRASWWWHTLGRGKQAAFVLSVLCFIPSLFVIGGGILIVDDADDGCDTFGGIIVTGFGIMLLCACIAGMAYLGLRPN